GDSRWFGGTSITRRFEEAIGLRRGKALERLMPLCELQDREGLAIDAFRRREDLPKDSAARPDDLSGEQHTRSSETVHRSFDVFDADGDMVKGLVAELLHPAGYDAALPPAVGIGLIHEQCRIA